MAIVSIVSEQASYIGTTKVFDCFVSLLLNVLVNSYGHVGKVTFDTVELLTGIEMNDTSSLAIKHCPCKQLWLIRDGPTCHLSWEGIGLLSR